MLDTVTLLYEALLLLNFNTPAQDAISRLCEAFYLAKMPDSAEVSISSTFRNSEPGSLVKISALMHLQPAFLLANLFPAVGCCDIFQMSAWMLSLCLFPVTFDILYYVHAGCASNNRLPLDAVGSRDWKARGRKACLQHQEFSGPSGMARR